MMSFKTCSQCKITKNINEFSFRNKNEIQKVKRSHCKKCTATRTKQYRELHKDKCMVSSKKYKENNSEKVKLNNRMSNKRCAVRIRNYETAKKKKDPAFRLRKQISTCIWQALFISGVSKNGSFTKYIPYTIQELKQHLQNQFEPWMTWDNHGMYDPTTWDNLDPTTWTWQLDHIIPQSFLPYASMEEENFQKCWALSNLRPLSAKQNIIDGNRRDHY